MFAGVIAGRSQSISLRRGTATLAAQTVRIEKRGNQSPAIRDSEAGGQIENTIVIIGAVSLDIQVGDRLNDALTGNLYEVYSVHPNRELVTQAIGRMVE
jgi:hypothetical protein